MDYLKIFGVYVLQSILEYRVPHAYKWEMVSEQEESVAKYLLTLKLRDYVEIHAGLLETFLTRLMINKGGLTSAWFPGWHSILCEFCRCCQNPGLAAAELKFSHVGFHDLQSHL